MELSTFLRERVTGTLVRSCFLHLEEMDAPSSFFFNLERSVARRKQMACFQLPNDRITTVLEEMKAHARSSCGRLFGVERCSLQSREEHLEGLPQLSPEEMNSLDCELTPEELTVAVKQVCLGRAQGIGILSTDL